MTVNENDVERIVRLIICREEHYAWNASKHAGGEAPLTEDHVFGEHVLVMKEKKAPMLPKSAAHLEQRIRAITASTVAALSAASAEHQS